MTTTLWITVTLLMVVVTGNLARAVVPSHQPDGSTAAPPTPLRATVVGTGQPMIFIPGLANSGEVWNTTVDHFRSRYECHVVTLAGFGGVPPVRGPFLETMRKAIADYVRDKRLRKPIVVGHSLGGFLAFLLGVTEPDLVGPLVIVDSAPCPPAIINDNLTAEELKQGEQIGRFMGAAKREDFLKQQRQMLGMWITDKDRLDRVMKWVEASDQATVARAMGELWTQDLRKQVAQIKAPVLLIGAPGKGETRAATMKRYERQVASITDKKVVFAELAGHFIMFDEPAWMWKQVEEFVAGRN